MTEPKPDIYVVGTGIAAPDHLTKEAERILSSCNEVLFVDSGPGLPDYLATICARVTDLSTLYEDGSSRLKTYHRMAARVLEAALDRAPVAFALYGHPLVYAYPPFLVRAGAAELGLRVKVVPGISAADCILTELNIDPATNGFQMYEATDVLLRRRPLQSDVPALIWQIGAVETGLYSRAPSRPERFSRFQKHLEKYYPRSHVVYAVCCATTSLKPATVLQFEIRQMMDLAHVLHAGYTLYIPPAAIQPVLDLELLGQIDDAQHLARITTHT
ncbi:SAM-dependent methyltransferase [Sorangium sp. So ce726]|uniref:SAM-dependent methyltransferase n=1 Tax=Sorangium sp. So ce726 TaxID=3133319 RepID=UPI003F60D4E9